MRRFILHNLILHSRPTAGARIHAALAVALASSIALAGCDKEKVLPPADQPPPYPVSPAACLDRLRTAYVARNLEQYRELFSGDFQFVFSPIDVIDPENPTPRNWPLENEVASTRHMFESDLVDKIELTFQHSDTTDSSNEYPGTWKIIVTEIQLRVYTRKDGEPLTLLVPQGTGVFYFRKSSENLWKIVRWEDAPGGKVQHSTWGHIKNVYL